MLSWMNTIAYTRSLITHNQMCLSSEIDYWSLTT